MTVRLYNYRASVLRVVDGDTVDVLVDQGFHSFRRLRLRLQWIDAPEKRGEQKSRGTAAAEHLEELIEQYAVTRDACGRPVIYVTTEKDRQGKYGRWLATLYGVNQRGDLIDLNVRMHADGFADWWDEED